MAEEEENPPTNNTTLDPNSQALGCSSSSMTRRNTALGVLRDARAWVEAAEAEMAKERDAVRAETDRRRAAVEVEMDRLVDEALQRIAGKSSGRKRKRAGVAAQEEVSPVREGVLLLGLLQCPISLGIYESIPDGALLARLYVLTGQAG